MSKAETNARVGRIYYQALTDAQGYPNGMAYWPDLEPQSKYHITAESLDFLRMLQEEGLIEIKADIGFSSDSKWGEGDCKALIDHFESTDKEEKEAFEKRLAEMRALYKKSPNDAG